MRDAGDQPAERSELLRLDQRGLGFAQIFQRLLGRLPRAPHLLLAALSVGDLLGGHVDGDDLAARRPQRMPIGDPGSLLRLVGALAGHLDAGDRLAGLHDRADDLLDRVGKRRHAIPDRSPEMILDRDAAYFGETLVDLQVTAVRRQAGQALSAPCHR